MGTIPSKLEPDHVIFNEISYAFHILGKNAQYIIFHRMEH